jgi:mitochondrial enoyl-[acyl-carrier protein] reductase / trans-2-enoyl-CoA reductase
MKSQRLAFTTHGKPADVLRLETFDLPPLGDGEILLAIHAAPINPADLNFIEGTYGIKPELPAQAGMECAATVIESRSEKFSPGDDVIPLARIGAWATHAVTTADNLIRIPAGIDPLQAAMLKVNPATAWLLLHHFETLHEGDYVALNAANSGVGQCVIQLAAAMGVRALCFVRNPDLAPGLLALGADAVFPDSQEGFGAAREILGKEKAKLAFNAVGGDSALRLMKLLANGGTHITYGAMARKPLTIPNGPLIFGDLRFRGLWVTKWMEQAPYEEVVAVYATLAARLLEGKLKQEVDSAFPLGDFAGALGRLEAQDRRGKILFRMDPTENGAFHLKA